MKLTLISDTHNKHKKLNDLLTGGDILIHAGDISSMGYDHEIDNFCKWFSSIESYTHKIFIAGNHDLLFEQNPERAMDIVNNYPNIVYLQDNTLTIGDGGPVIYGSPWQPRFYNWAFNADRGEDIKKYWDKIPENTDI
jgi:predicted phosphodiesterase